MKNRNALGNRTTRRILPVFAAAAMAMAFAVSAPRAAHAGDEDLTPPPMPANIEVDEPHKVFLVGHAVGTQNYVCLPSGSGFAWTLFTPQATLFNEHGQQLTTHFFGPNPDEGDVIRAAWQHSRDTSTFWGRLAENGSSTDERFVAPNSIPWLKLERAGVENGPTGGGTLAAATFVQRLNTLGGVAPSSGCSVSTDVGKKAFVPYRADYFFYSDQSQAGSN